VHSLRGPTYALLFAVVPNFALHGSWFWVLCALLVFDLALSIWDFAIERSSRARLGGLPTGEYELHVLLGMLFGAFVALLLSAAASWAGLPTAVVHEPVPVPEPLRWVLWVMALGVFASGAADARAWWRLRSAPGRGAPVQPAEPQDAAWRGVHSNR
jgi:hypothetical protein